VLVYESKIGEQNLMKLIKLIIFVLLSLVIPSQVWAMPPVPWEADELIGNKAPDFTLPDLDGIEVSLKQFRGKTILLNFWATWCPPCKAEMPSMNILKHIFKDKGLVILAVSSDRSKKQVKRFLKKTPVNFTILHDPKNKISRIYKVFALPTSLIINRDGIIVKKVLGGYDWSSPESINLFRPLIELSSPHNP